MTDWTTFDGRIEPLEWGRKTYTILRLPPPVMAALGAAKRVAGEIADYPVNLAVTRAPVLSDPFLYAGKTFLSAAGLEPGDVVEVRLCPVDPNLVETPDDVAHAIRATGRWELWDDTPPGQKRALLHTVETAKRPETRQRRIAALIAGL